VVGRASTAIGIVAAALAVAVGPAAAATFTVTDRGDRSPQACAPGSCTLREAVIAANARPGADTIVLRAGRHELSLASTGEDAAADGDLDITSGPLLVVRRGPGRAVIDANGIDRVFDIGTARTRLQRLVITGGNAHPIDGDGDGGGITAGDLGDAPVTLADSEVIDNRAPGVDGNGGGIDTDIAGALTVVRSRIIGNVAGGDGGGITGSVDGPTLISRSTIADNRAGEGGGVMVVDRALITDSTIAGNHVVGGGDGELGDGAGIYVDDQGVLTLVNATLTGNRAHRHGAGVFGESGGRAALRAVTIARNRADADGSGDGGGGGVFADRARVTLSNAIVALNTAAGGILADCDGTATVTGSPILLSTPGRGGCRLGGALIARDPRLAPLAANGGLTRTIALRRGSPAVGAARAASAPPRDQRGVRRADPDLGAFELR
jgi:parallel beta helix pectate lyase-like protein